MCRFAAIGRFGAARAVDFLALATPLAAVDFSDAAAELTADPVDGGEDAVAGARAGTAACTTAGAAVIATGGGGADGFTTAAGATVGVTRLTALTAATVAVGATVGATAAAGDLPIEASAAAIALR
jgi:hypothetical protein